MYYFLLVAPAPPVVGLPPSPIQGTIVGNSHSIICIAITPVAVDVDLLNFTWIGPGGNITNNNRTIINSTTVIDNMYTSILYFAYLLHSDGGNYNCNVAFFNVTRLASVVMEPPDCECVKFV